MHKIITNRKNKPTMLVILDGFGHREETQGNAIKLASMPFWRHITTNYPFTTLKAAGEDVGLPPDFVGNSEVGHRCLGAGRIVPTVLKKFHQSISDKSIYNNPLLIKEFKRLQATQGSLHLMGLLSDAGVHSHQEHLHALIKCAYQQGIKKVFIHAFLDGRDSAITSAHLYLQRLENYCKELGCGTIASLHGRFFAMDRDNNWERIAQSYYTMCNSNPLKHHDLSFSYKNWQEVLNDYYKKGITDEFIPPILLNPQGSINKGDGIVFYNLRADRARQLAESFLNPHFTKFKKSYLELSFFISTTQYRPDFAQWKNQTLFDNEKIENTLLDEITRQVNAQGENTTFSIAESEKYGHISYFFRGEKEEPLPRQKQLLIPSLKTRNYVRHPEMSAPHITALLLKSLKNNPAYFYLVNFANADMVGHSGNLPATIKACESLDKHMELLYHQVVVENKGTLFITADHGNAEEMIDTHTLTFKTGHTRSVVPFVVVAADAKQFKLSAPGTLGIAHVAPTILKYLRLSTPPQMLQKTIF